MNQGFGQLIIYSYIKRKIKWYFYTNLEHRINRNVAYQNISLYVSLFSGNQKVNDSCGQPIYIQEQCSTFDIDKGK